MINLQLQQPHSARVGFPLVTHAALPQRALQVLQPELHGLPLPAHSQELDKHSHHLNDGVYEDLVSAPGRLTGAQVPEDVLGDAGELVLVIEEPN